MDWLFCLSSYLSSRALLALAAELRSAWTGQSPVTTRALHMSLAYEPSSWLALLGSALCR